MNSILIAIAVVGIIGLICSVMLSVASKFMSVKVDERIPLVRDCLPGANCGACGFAGCDGYAKALVEDPSTPANLCTPGGASAAAQIANVLGREAGEVVKQVAVVKCNGNCEATSNKMEYVGIASCSAAKLLYGGSGKCIFGCLGLGDCAKVCPNDAIYINSGVAHVDEELCTGCGLCSKACPNGVIAIQPDAKKVTVECSSREKGANTRKNCINGCIGCKMCERNCPNGAITVEDNLAHIDYSKCDGCGKCVEVCKPGCLLVRK